MSCQSSLEFSEMHVFGKFETFKERLEKASSNLPVSLCNTKSQFTTFTSDVCLALTTSSSLKPTGKPVQKL